MEKYEYVRSFNPNCYGPKDSCVNMHPLRKVKRRRIGDHKYTGFQVHCLCLKSDNVWYHSIEQAIYQHDRRIKEHELKQGKQLEFNL